MTLLNDAMLALIARFVVDDLDHLSISDEQFLQQQIDEIKSHVSHLPKEQQQKYIFEWIEQRAENYRNEWLRKKLTQLLVKQRCSDCPLINDGSNSNCIIHQSWVELLKDYMSGKIDSEHYVEEALQLLGEHKEDLKIACVIKHAK